MWVLFTHCARLLISEKSPSSFSACATKARACSAVAGPLVSVAGGGGDAGALRVSGDAVVQAARQMARARAETLAFMGRTSSFRVWSRRLLRLVPEGVKRR